MCLTISPVCCAILVSITSTPAAAQIFPPSLAITEFDYEQVGTDSLEWIEIANMRDAAWFVNGIDLVLYDADPNGNCVEYCRVDLSPLVVLFSGVHVVIGNHPCASLPLCQEVDAIQNGSPDAIALGRPADGTVLDLVEYASSFTGSTCGTPFVNRTSATDSDVADGSLQICLAWRFNAVSSPCQPNDCVATDVGDSGPLPVSWDLFKRLYR